MKLFISYAHDDKAFVQQLVDALRQAGHDPWFDPHLVPGQEWQRELLSAIEACDAFIYALTPTSIISEWCQYEFFTATKLNKPIIPVLVKDAELPLVLKNYQYADLREGVSYSAMMMLVTGLQNAEKARPSAVSQPPITAAVATSTQPRRLEAAMPAQTTQGTKTELWVKVSRQDSEGLRGQLPATVVSGDIIQKSDARADIFPLTFKRDEKTGELLPAEVCLKITSDDFDAAAESDHSHDCSDGQVPLTLQPDYDSRTVVFELTPKAGRALAGRVRMTVHLYQKNKLIAQIGVSTDIVQMVVRQESVSWEMLAASLLSSIGLNLSGEPFDGLSLPTLDDLVLGTGNVLSSETDQRRAASLQEAPSVTATHSYHSRERAELDGEKSASAPPQPENVPAPPRQANYNWDEIFEVELSHRKSSFTPLLLVFILLIVGGIILIVLLSGQFTGSVGIIFAVGTVVCVIALLRMR
ncbi:MAG: toll/interleukin-1 receptor domain-containing protein [Burkholderiales bacterium]|nr:toll/interleukin-1 receptor domain-containing protein [Anaerolineae bacterium]